MTTNQPPSREEQRSPLLSDWDRSELLGTLILLDELLKLKNLAQRHRSAVLLCHEAVLAEAQVRGDDWDFMVTIKPPWEEPA